MHDVPRWRVVDLVRLNLRDVGDKVHVGGGDRTLPLPDTSSDVENWEERKGEVVRDKVGNSPLALQEDCGAGELRVRNEHECR